MQSKYFISETNSYQSNKFTKKYFISETKSYQSNMLTKKSFISVHIRNTIPKSQIQTLKWPFFDHF